MKRACEHLHGSTRACLGLFRYNDPYQNMHHCLNLRHRQCIGVYVTMSQDKLKTKNFIKLSTTPSMPILYQGQN